MPKFEPFAALRYAPGTNLDHVIAPPYDVLLPEDIAQLASRHPRNIIHVDMPEGEGAKKYERANELLREWIAAGTLVADSEPTFTIYRMRFTDSTGRAREVSGVFGGLEVVDLNAGGVLPHERTTPKASTDRLDITRATATNLSPVWGLSLAKGLTEALSEPAEHVGSLTVDGVEHVVERLSDPVRIQRVREIIGSDDVLIADGHHRYGVGRAYRDEIRERTGRTDTEAETVLTFVNELVEDQLSIEAIHRIYRGVSAEALAHCLSKHFVVEPAPAPTAQTLAQMVDEGRLVLLDSEGRASWLTAREGAFDGVRSLDGAWLEHALEGCEGEVDYQHGLDEVLGLLSEGEVDAAILIRPTSMLEIERTAREGLLMPPKSTFFTPKLRTGLVLREVPEGRR